MNGRILTSRQIAWMGIGLVALVAAAWGPQTVEAKPPHAGPPAQAGGAANGGPPGHTGPPEHARATAPSSTGSSGAVVERNLDCVQDRGDGSLIDGEGNGKIKVITPSGNAIAVCVSDEGERPQDVQGAQHFDFDSTGGELCTITDPGSGDAYPTERWQSVVTPSGQAIMICHALD